MPRLPTVVVGAGLAGACAAAVLAPLGPVVVLDAVGPAAGASGAAAGLVHPFTGRRAHRAWRATEARAALDRMAEQAGVSVTVTGVLRPAQTPRQAEDFARAAHLFPAEAMWIETAAERWPDVSVPLGALWIPGGGHVDVGALVRGLLDAARRDGADVRTARLTEWTETTFGCRVLLHQNSEPRPSPFSPPRGEMPGRAERGSADPSTPTKAGDEIEAERLILCPGHGITALPQLAGRSFGYVRGQTVTLDAVLPLGFPAVAGGVYVVPTSRGAVVGATFEHTFSHLDPDPRASLDLRDRAARIVPALAEADVIDARVGVRVTVPATVSPERLPVLERVSERVWLFTGLGSRGLLTAPLLARTLAPLVAGG